MTLANKLTLARLVLAILTFLCLWTHRPPYYAAALALYLTAVITDWFDGYLARRTHSVSPFGALADPIADKVLVIGALIALVHVRPFEIPTWAVFLIIVRELVIGGLRALAGISGKVMGANRAGKWTMAVQSVAVLLILALLVARHYAPWPLPDWTVRIPYGLVVLCVAMSLWSGLHYLYDSRSLLRKSWNAPRRLSQ